MSHTQEQVKYPQYIVNGLLFGSDYQLANLYWHVQGGILMEKLDGYTPWHVLKSTRSMS